MAGKKIGRIEKTAISSGNAVYVIEGSLPQLTVLPGRYHLISYRNALPVGPIPTAARKRAHQSEQQTRLVTCYPS